ncbi:unnamed protein product [Rhizophagus irregularis]|nr:unnamed protein product [Rhizophagus irregularis]CAB4434506.1 unnamed protein product [Rhizophagus irregularis]
MSTVQYIKKELKSRIASFVDNITEPHFLAGNAENGKLYIFQDIFTSQLSQKRSRIKSLTIPYQPTITGIQSKWQFSIIIKYNNFVKMN